jgi:hypothetical protein
MNEARKLKEEEGGDDEADKTNSKQVPSKLKQRLTIIQLFQ